MSQRAVRRLSIRTTCDPEAEALGIEAANTANAYPSDEVSRWCNDDGIKRLLDIAAPLRAMAQSSSLNR